MSRLLASFLAAFLTILLGAGPAPAQDGSKIMVLPITAKTPDQETSLPRFTELVREHFGERDDVIFLSEDQFESLLGNSTGSRQDLLRAAGEQLHCSTALAITLNRYRERLGDEYSATDPASVAFEYRLIATGDGKVLCFGQFDETQQPVSENILNLGTAYKRGFKWITVDELAREGLTKKFDTCAPLAAKGP